MKLLEDIHFEKGHISYIGLYKEIMAQKYYWRNIVEDCKNYVENCTTCLKLRGGKKITLCPK